MLAIQALERRTRELQGQLELKDQEIGQLRAEVAALLDRVERLEAQQ
jgi:chromosome segregation ATPase